MRLTSLFIISWHTPSIKCSGGMTTPIINTVIRINKSASNNSKYAAKRSLMRRYILLYFSKKASRGGAHGLQDLQNLQDLQDLQDLHGLNYLKEIHYVR